MAKKSWKINRGGEGKVAIVILYHAINETAQRKGKFGKEEKGKNGKRGNYISKVKKILFYLIPGWKKIGEKYKCKMEVQFKNRYASER